MGIVGVCLIVLLGLTLARDDSGVPADFGADPARAVERTASVPSAGDGPSSVPAAADRAGPPAVPAPSSVRIPRLGLRAPVDPVGVAPDGQVVVPEDPDRVGWYRFSPLPGAGAGSSVIVGHVDATGRGLGVLAALSQVREGDRVAVDRQDGSTVAYRIASRRTVAKNALSGSGAFRREGRPTLTLITCAGPYLREEGGYQNNLVVTAVAVPK
ncbi:class F sortase [Streptomyces griseus]|uniref:class F sortase n=1 Tax=Streptomyces griseus TaxID=1911 RepID=UPI000D129B61|nr:class F sortase [Streptomyces griseus]